MSEEVTQKKTWYLTVLEVHGDWFAPSLHISLEAAATVKRNIEESSHGASIAVHVIPLQMVAAAPVLLAALQRFQGIAQPPMPSACGKEDYAEWDEATEQVNAAIAKAQPQETPP